MTTLEKAKLGLGAVAGLTLAAAAVVTIGNNTGTQVERCDRFWQSSAASSECHQRLADAGMDLDAARSADLQQQIDAGQRRIDQTEQNIRNADRASADLQAARPRWTANKGVWGGLWGLRWQRHKFSRKTNDLI